MSRNNNTDAIPQSVLNEYLLMGCNEELLRVAWKQCKGQEANLLDEYTNLQLKNDSMLQESKQSMGAIGGMGMMDEENQLNQAIMASVQDVKGKGISFEPLNPEQRQRKEGIPVGLKNLGNTCYINPLLQVYFYNIEFVSALMRYVSPSDEEIKEQLLQLQQIPSSSNSSSDDAGQAEFQALFRRVKASVGLVVALQELYVQLTGSDKKYIDPSTVIKSLVDEQGNPLQIGEQQDIGEFNLVFLACIEEGLKHFKGASKSMEVEGEKNVVQKNFFGSNLVMMEYQLGDELFQKQEQENFNILYLEIKHKELYNALDECVVNMIDEFKNDRGDIVPATKHNWISRAPNTLFFQLQRVVFDKEKCSLIKLNDPFQIEREIFMERFTAERKNDYLQIRANVKKLIAEKQAYEQALKEILNYSSFVNQSNSASNISSGSQIKGSAVSSGGAAGTNGSNAGAEQATSSASSSLVAVLESTKVFLATNSQRCNVNPLENSAYFGENAKENAAIIAALDGYVVKVKARINQLQASISDLQSKISESYNAFRKERFVLQAILIHDGQAESGHYYAFIQDIQVKKWWRYNDIQVSEETEENVFKESIGGWGKASAYSLIYVREEVALPPAHARHIPLHSHLVSASHQSMSASQVRVADFYTTMIPEDLLNTLCADNMKFSEEIEEYKTTNAVRSIMEMYTKRFELNNECSRKSEEARKTVKGSPPPFIQFCVYLKLHAGNENGGAYDDLIKWLILDSCVREVYKNAQTLSNLTDKRLADKLKLQISSLSTFKAPKSITIAKETLSIIEMRNTEFIKQLQNAETTIYTMSTALKFDWVSCFASMNYLLDKNQFLSPTVAQNQKDDYFFKISRDTKMILLTAFMHYQELAVKVAVSKGQFNSEQALLFVKIAVAFYKKQFKFDQKTQITFNAWITDIAVIPKNAEFESAVKNIVELYMGPASQERFVAAEDLIQIFPQELNDRHIKVAQEGDLYYWNANKKEDCLFNELISNFEKVKGTFNEYIQFTVELKKSNMPFFQANRTFNNKPANFGLQ